MTAAQPDAGFQTIVDLDALTASAGEPKPDVSVLARRAGANVIRISFRAGQVMDDHTAGKPIVVVGQRGTIDFAIGDEHVSLTPGVAVHVDAGVTHSLTAESDAAVTLILLTGGQ